MNIQYLGSNKEMEIGEQGRCLRSNPSTKVEDVIEFTYIYKVEKKNGCFQILNKVER